jgi:hypothetical protein
MSRKAIFFALIYVTSVTANGLADPNTCEWYSKERPRLDSKILSILLGQEPREAEEMMLWLDRYCQDNPKDSLVGAMRKFSKERSLRG